jgi:hypothetical protein
MANPIVKLNGRNLYDGLAESTTFNCFFETLSVSGRGLAPTRDRQLQFPGDVGARDYGSLPDVRRITITGTLHADTIQAFEYGLDQLKQLCRSRLKVDSILYGEAEAQTLWFADESVVLGPLPYGNQGDVSGDYWISNLGTGPDPQGARYNHSDGDLVDYKIEFISTAGGGATDYRGYLFDHWKTAAYASARMFFLKPTPSAAAFGGSNPQVNDQFWIRDDRYYLVNYSGTMNEERLTRQWFAHGLANITLPFKAVYPYAVSEVKNTEFTPNSTNGYFKAITTGTAPTFPTYRIKGAANTPKIVEATHSLVWNANDSTAKGILDEDVSATVSAANFYGQTGKLKQAIAFDTNLDKTQSDYMTITGQGVRSDLGVGSSFNCNQGSIGFWYKKAGNIDTSHPFTMFHSGRFAVNNSYVSFTYSGDKLYLDMGAQFAATSSGFAAATPPGNWYYVIGRWDCRRTGFSSANSSAYITLAVYNTSGSVVASGTGTANVTDPTQAGGTMTFAHNDDGSGGVIFREDFLLDDFAIWDRPLTDTEVSTLVNSGTGVRADTVASSELVYYSDFDGTVGTAFDATQLANSNMDTAQASATTTTSATVSGYGDKIFADNDRAVLYDETGYKKDVVVNGSATSTNVPFDNGSGGSISSADHVGVSCYMNASTDHLYPADGTSVCNITTNDFTWSFWLKNTTTDASWIVSKYNTTTSPNWYIYQETTGVIIAGINDGSSNVSVTGTVAVNDGKWHHVCFVADRSGNGSIYIDGVLDTSGSISSASGTLSNTASNMVIGCLPWSAVTYNYNGYIRDVAFWTSALTAANVLTLATNPISGAGTVGSAVNRWKMTEAWTTSMADDGSGSNALTVANSPTRTQLAYISRNLIADGGMENGGIGSYQSGDAASEVVKDSSQVKKDAQSIKITNGDATPAAFRTIWTTSSGEDYIIRAWHRGAATVAVQNILAVGATAIINTSQAGISANTWSFVEACYEATSTSTDMYIQNSSTTSSESSYWDDIKILKNLVNNGGMEAGSTGIATGWSKLGTLTPTLSTTNKHSGSQSQAISGGVWSGGSANGYLLTTVTGLVAGEWYEVSAWAMSSTVHAGPRLFFSDTNAGTLGPWSSADFTRKSKIFKAIGTSTVIYLNLTGTDHTITGYLDDLAIVHRPDLTATFNNMTTGYRYEPTRLTRGYKTGYNEPYKFLGQTTNSNEYSARVVFRPQFPSTNTENQYIFESYVGNSDKWVINWSGGKFYFQRRVAGSWHSISGPTMTFNQDEEIEVGGTFDTTNGMKMYVNGSDAGTTTSANTDPLTYSVGAYQVVIGRDGVGTGYQGNYIIDDLEILAKSMPAEWFAEQHAKRVEAKNQNLIATYSSTLDAGDILTIDASASKVISRAKLWDASASTESDALTNMTINQSKMPILSPEKAMLYFPNSIPSGVEIFYRNNFQ